jgi:hypothetical protein
MARGLPRLEGLLGSFEKTPSNGWYGYGTRYFTSFDPYEMKSTSVSNVSAEFVIAMKNALALSRRAVAAHRQVVIAATGGSEDHRHVAKVERGPVSDDLSVPPPRDRTDVSVDDRERGPGVERLRRLHRRPPHPRER